MKYSGKVLIEKEQDKSTKTSDAIRKNPHAVANVNQPQGPRHGNTGAHLAKRGNFKAAKEERAPLAGYIERAFAGRGTDDKDSVQAGLEPIASSSERRFKK